MNITDLSNKHSVEFSIATCTVYSVESDNTITVKVVEFGAKAGMLISQVRQTVALISDAGPGEYVKPDIGALCVVAIITKGNSQDAYVLGYIQRFSLGDDYGTNQPKLAIGDRVWQASKDAYFLLRRNGIIELKAHSWLHVALKPNSGTLYAIFKNLDLYRDPLNRFRIYETDKNITAELGVWANLAQLPAANPKDPHVLFRVGATRSTGPDAGRGIHQHFDDNSLVKSAVETYDASGVTKRSTVIFGVGKIDTDGTSVRLTLDDTENPSSVKIKLGKQDSGTIFDIEVADQENTTQLQIGSIGDVVIRLDVNEKATFKIEKTGKTAVALADNLEVSSAKDIVLDGSGAILKLTGNKVALGNSSVELVNETIQLSKNIRTSQPVGISNMGPVNLHPGLIAKLQQLENRLNQIKGVL